jgi:hypothetical protein
MHNINSYGAISTFHTACLSNVLTVQNVASNLHLYIKLDAGNETKFVMSEFCMG